MKMKKRYETFVYNKPKQLEPIVYDKPTCTQKSERTSKKIETPGPTYYLVEKYHVTQHAIEQFIKRITYKDTPFNEMSHKKREFLWRNIYNKMPKGFENTDISMRVQTEMFTAVIKDGVVVTIYGEED